MTIIYNKSNGKVILMMSEKIDEVSSVVADIPDGYTVSSVNAETGEPVLEPIPKTEDQLRLEALERQMNALLGVESEETA